MSGGDAAREATFVEMEFNRLNRLDLITRDLESVLESVNGAWPSKASSEGKAPGSLSEIAAQFESVLDRLLYVSNTFARLFGKVDDVPPSPNPTPRLGTR